MGGLELFSIDSIRPLDEFSSGYRGSIPGAFQPLVHYEGIHEAVLRVPERLGEGPDHFEPELFPEPYGPDIGGDHQIVLHRPESALDGLPRHLQAAA